MTPPLDLTCGEDITKPMAIVLYSGVDDESRGDRPPRWVDSHLYPWGQMRLILNGLLGRDLVEPVDPALGSRPYRLTDTGLTLAQRIYDAVYAYYPGRRT